MADDRWSATKSSKRPPSSPPCERCTSNNSERYRTGMGEVICVNLVGCRARRAALPSAPPLRSYSHQQNGDRSDPGIVSGNSFVFGSGP